MSAIGNDVPQPPPVVETPPAPASPWAADAAAYFGDNAEAIAGFDRYMREKQQPYVTQLEASTKDAREYYNDLMNDTDTTLRSLIGQRYGDEFAAEFDGLFNEPAPEPVVEPPAAEDEVPEWAKPLVEDHASRRDRELTEKHAAEYEAAKTELRTAHPDLTDADMPLIDSFVANPAFGGDLEAAYTALQHLYTERGVVAAPPAADVPAPPPVLGADGVAATPPLATQYTRYDQIGDALKAHLSSQRASSTPPPVVG